MKKLVSVLFALLLVGSFAFADVAIGGWGRFIYSPLASVDGGDNYAFSAPSWANGGRVGFNVVGSSDNAGFKLNVDSNGNGIGVGDNAKIWIKLNDMITIQGGKVQGDVLRGKIDDSGTLNAIAIAQGTTGKDAVFQRFYPKLGLLVDITPMEGLYIGAALDAAYDVTTITDVDFDATGKLVVTEESAASGSGLLSEDMFKNIQVGFGYVIPDVGHFRAQYVGADDIKKRYDAKSAKGLTDYIAELLEDGDLAELAQVVAYLEGAEGDEAKYINVAFAYTAMEGLVVDAGAKIQTVSDTAQHTVAVHTTYNKDALGVIGRVNLGIGDDGASDEMAYGASVDVSYTVADPLAVGFEASYAKRDDPYTLSILPYGKMGYGNGYAKAGFLFSSVDTGADTYSSWALPIVLEYWF